VRSERQSVFRLGLGSNRFLGWTVLGTLLVQLGLLYWPPAQTALDLQPLALGDLAVVVVASTTAFWAIEAEKPSSEGCGPPRGPHVEGRSLRLLPS
jgi:Ca2+-transporting ATPase